MESKERENCLIVKFHLAVLLISLCNAELVLEQIPEPLSR